MAERRRDTGRTTIRAAWPSNRMVYRRKQEDNKMVSAIAAALAVGAGAAYFLDPERGRRRRAGAMDRLTHAVHTTRDALDATSRDVRNRLVGTAASVRAHLSHDDPSDEVLVERVRARLGALVRHARALDVSAQDGRVTLRGPVLAEDVEHLIAGVRRVRGVRAVDNQLVVHDDSAGIPALQGDPPQRGPRSMFMRATWPPAARLLAGTAGALVTAYGLKGNRTLRPLAALAGLGLVTRALTNLEFKRLIGDLVRLKSSIEEGRTRVHGRRVTRDDLEDSRRDEVGRTGIWPVSGPLPPGEASIVDQGDLGHPLVDRPEQETVAAAFIIDPVCGMSVEILLAERCEYNGQSYYFHSVECRQQFDATPERFTTALDRRRSA